MCVGWITYSLYTVHHTVRNDVGAAAEDARRAVDVVSTRRAQVCVSENLQRSCLRRKC